MAENLLYYADKLASGDVTSPMGRSILPTSTRRFGTSTTHNALFADKKVAWGQSLRLNPQALLEIRRSIDSAELVFSRQRGGQPAFLHGL